MMKLCCKVDTQRSHHCSVIPGSLHCCLQFHMNLSTWTFLWDEMNINFSKITYLHFMNIFVIMNRSTVVTECNVTSKNEQHLLKQALLYLMIPHFIWHGVVDDKASVCEAHIEGFKQDC